MRIIASDTTTDHGNWMKSLIQEICPEAEVEVRIESLSASVDYAINNGFEGICRPTTGLSDSRISNEGKRARDNGIWIIHAHGSNSNIELSNSTYIGEIISVRGSNNSWGLGVEFTVGVNTESEATGKLTGIVAKLLVDHQDWDIDKARQALRQTASSWQDGWNKSVGFGTVSLEDANAVTSILPLNSLYHVNSADSQNREITISFSDFIGHSNYKISAFENLEITNNPNQGVLLYEGPSTKVTVQHTLNGNYYIQVFADFNSQLTRNEEFSSKQSTFHNLASPEIDFNADQTIGYESLTVQFQENINGSFTSLLWEFGDGETSTELNPTHTYSNIGIYNVKLTTYQDGIKTSSLLKSEFIEVRRIDFDFYREEDTVHFENHSVGKIERFLWDFDDGTISNEKDPVKTYGKIGFYQPTLTVFWKNGDKSLKEVSDPIIILEVYMKLSDHLDEIKVKKPIKAEHISSLLYAIMNSTNFEDSAISFLMGTADFDAKYMGIDFTNPLVDFDFSTSPRFNDYIMRVISGEIDLDGNIMELDFNKSPLVLDFN